jgi:hypothetical protein
MRKVRKPFRPVRLGETWIEAEELAYASWSGASTDSRRRGLVRFPDGQLRIVRLGVADSFDSIPARPYRGHAGVVIVEDNEFRFWPRQV